MHSIFVIYIKQNIYAFNLQIQSRFKIFAIERTLKDHCNSTPNSKTLHIL